MLEAPTAVSCLNRQRIRRPGGVDPELAPSSCIERYHGEVLSDYVHCVPDDERIKNVRDLIISWVGPCHLELVYVRAIDLRKGRVVRGVVATQVCAPGCVWPPSSRKDAKKY